MSSDSKLDAPITLHKAPLSWVGWLPIIVLPPVTIFFGRRLTAWIFMWMLCVVIFAGLKWITWWKARTVVEHTAMRSAAYLIAWPGMEAEVFLDPNDIPAKPRLRYWIFAALETLLGITLIWVVARMAPGDLLKGWIGMVGLIFLLHFGSFQLLAYFWQSVGVMAKPIMDNPLQSHSLSEFWGRRWNLGFRQLAHELIFRPARRHIGVPAAGFLVFVFSGLIHDLVISLPARADYGLPTGYFVLQGLGVMLERSSLGNQLGLRDGWAGWMFMVALTAGPAFWLFHPPFVTRVMIPFFRAIWAI